MALLELLCQILKVLKNFEKSWEFSRIFIFCILVHLCLLYSSPQNHICVYVCAYEHSFKSILNVWIVPLSHGDSWFQGAPLVFLLCSVSHQQQADWNFSPNKLESGVPLKQFPAKMLNKFAWRWFLLQMSKGHPAPTPPSSPNIKCNIETISKAFSWAIFVSHWQAAL